MAAPTLSEICNLLKIKTIFVKSVLFCPWSSEVSSILAKVPSSELFKEMTLLAMLANSVSEGVKLNINTVAVVFQAIYKTCWFFV